MRIETTVKPIVPPRWTSLMVVFFFALTTGLGFAQTNKAYEKYIEEYKAVAISEMERSGIPASIKMAQALLESEELSPLR